MIIKYTIIIEICLPIKGYEDWDEDKDMWEMYKLFL